MSGRGRGRGNNGRGRFQSSGRNGTTTTYTGGNSKSSYKPSKKTLSDYIYYLGSAKQAADFDTTTEYILNHIIKTFTFGNDIATALTDENGNDYDMNQHKPTLEQVDFSTTLLTDVEIEVQNEQYKIEFKAEYDAYMKRKQFYEANTTKAYALLWEQCSKGMQGKIEANENFSSKIKGKPIELLKIIKQNCLNYHEHRYEMSIILDSMKTLFNVKQKDNESLQDYTKRFKTARDVMKSHIGGPIILTRFVENMPGYDPTKPDEITIMQEKAQSQFLAYMYLDNADKAKYGTLLTGLHTQTSLKNNQYPKTITEANNVLSNHRFDNAGKQQHHKPNQNSEKTTNNNNKEEIPEMSFAMLEGKCYCCGKSGHKSPSCRLKDKTPKEEWAINKAKSTEQSHVNSETKDSKDNNTPSNNNNNNNNNNNSNALEGWSGAHVQFYQADEMKEWIILDNGSTVDLFCNPNLVTNIYTTSETLEISTNGGKLSTNKKATVPNYGEVWYDPGAITNIFSLSEMEKKYHVTYDSSKESAFIVQLPTKQVKFTKSFNGLYYLKPTYNTNNGKEKSLVNHSIESVKENKLLYTDRQVQRAKLARNIYHAIGTPSLKDFKLIITSNMIKNIPITIDDINIAEKIFGPDVGALKGKTTRQKPAPVVEDYVEVPKELIDNHQNVTLCMDGIKINGVPFLTTISRNIMYRTAEWVPNQTPEAYRSVLDNVFQTYNKAGFRISIIHCDNEFRPLMTQLQNIYNVQMNYANPQEHVPEAERNNRVIKERFRSAFHRLPFKAIPKIMVKILTMECAKKLNFFPPIGGISTYYSPRMIMHQKTLDYDKHCSIPFGAYVQAHTEPNPTNSQHPRTLDCIYLRYVDNNQGGHHLLDLRTGRTIKRRTVTNIPITQNVIDLVHEMARNDHMQNGLKIEARAGTILYDSTWIAGVDYETITPKSDEENEENTEEFEEIIENDDKNDIQGRDPDEPIEFLKNEQSQTPVEIVDDITEVEEPENYDQNILQNDLQQDGQDGEIEENEENNNNEDNPIRVEDDEQEEYDEQLFDFEVNQNNQRTRSGRTTKVPDRLTFNQYQLLTQGHKETLYSSESAQVIAKTMHYLNHMVQTTKNIGSYSFATTFSLKKGLKKFGKKGYDAAFGEIKQLHDRIVFQPINVNNLSPLERKRALESLIFLVEKRDGRIKGRYCANGSTQREYINKEDAASPTAVTESIIITATIDAKENRDVMSADIPNAFVQTDMEKIGSEKVIMKIRGVLVDMLISIDKELYEPFVTKERDEKILYVELLKALYGTLQAALLFYKKLKKDLESIGFKVNPYDPCVANRTVNGTQHTVTWHVDDLKSSHVDAKVNDEFLLWLEKMYGDKDIAPVKATRGKIHDYLAMKLDYSEKGKLKLNMVDYVDNMIQDFPEEVTTSNYPWNENLFKVDPSEKQLPKEQRELFHTFVAKALFLCKRARPDIQPAIAFLTTRVKSPDRQDWAKLLKVMGYLKKTRQDVMVLHADESGEIIWHVDAAFAVHNDKKSHTGATMSLGGGGIMSLSTKQKVNTRSSTEAELVSLDDIIAKVIWTKLFLQAQDYKVKQNIIMRDNISSMKLEMNGKTSSGKRTRHLDIKYFYITDLINQKQVTIQYCPTDAMLADYMTKPLTGAKFQKFRQAIMNCG
jgi:Reverse transcriptase (RNA-dependent DNA polymerase)